MRLAGAACFRAMWALDFPRKFLALVKHFLSILSATRKQRMKKCLQCEKVNIPDEQDFCCIECAATYAAEMERIATEPTKRGRRKTRKAAKHRPPH